jgi:hypothetical protein
MTCEASQRHTYSPFGLQKQQDLIAAVSLTQAQYAGGHAHMQTKPGGPRTPAPLGQWATDKCPHHLPRWCRTSRLPAAAASACECHVPDGNPEEASLPSGRCVGGHDDTLTCNP